MSTFKGFKDYPDTSTPLTAEFLNILLDYIFPIGKVVCFEDDLDHSDYMGFTWIRTSIGKMPIGYDQNDSDFDTIGATGGEKTHTLTISEMPSHNHGLGVITSGVTGGIRNLVGGSDRNTTASDIVDKKGGNQPHNNMPPYQVFAFWKRIEASE